MNCPNCNEEIKNGLIKSNNLFSQDSIDFINSELNLKAEVYCDACGSQLLKEAKIVSIEKQKDMVKDAEEAKLTIKSLKATLSSRNATLVYYLNQNITNIPIITTHTPYNWEYTSLELVSGQTITGTGLVSEVFSDFTDFFGAKSNSFTAKLSKSEVFVLNQLKAKTVQLGGNAVIATDIDYGEAGAGKGMLMVCAAGTAISLNNLEVLEDKKKRKVSDIVSWQNEKTVIENILSLKDEDFMPEYNKYIAIYGELTS